MFYYRSFFFHWSFPNTIGNVYIFIPLSIFLPQMKKVIELKKPGIFWILMKFLSTSRSQIFTKHKFQNNPIYSTMFSHFGSVVNMVKVIWLLCKYALCHHNPFCSQANTILFCYLRKWFSGWHFHTWLYSWYFRNFW